MRDTPILSLLSAGFALGVIFTIIIALLTGSTYQEGQIDCINGNIKYELVVQPDSSKTWEPITQ